MLRALPLLCLLSFPAIAQAQNASSTPAAHPYRVVFTSSTACRDPSQFTEELRRRTGRFRPASALEPAVTFLVDLVRTEALVRGQLIVRDMGGGLTVREVPGVDCREVLSAMALIGALLAESLVSPRPEVRVEARAGAAPDPPRWAFGVAQRLTAHSAILSGLAVGLSIQAHVDYQHDGFWSPRLRLAAHRAQGRTPVQEPGAAELLLRTARASLCPGRWVAVPGLELRPCASLDAGQLTASGFFAADLQEASVFWSAAGLEVAAEVVLVGPLTLGAEAAVLFPFIRDTFYFDPISPISTVHRIPASGFSAAIGLGVHFF